MLLLLSLVLILSTPPAPTPASAPKPKSNTQISTETQKMLGLINAERAEVGVGPLVTDVHTPPTYGSPFDMLGKFGVTFNAAAENIAKNSSVEAAHAALMASEGHHMRFQ